MKVVKVWNRIATFVRDPANQAEAVKIMAARAGVPPEEYAKFMPGTRFLSPEEALTRFEPKDTLDSLFGSGKVADEFNVANKVYTAAAAGRGLHRRVAVEGGARARALAKEAPAK